MVHDFLVYDAARNGDNSSPPGVVESDLFQIARDSSGLTQYGIVRLCADKRLDVNTRHRFGWTALHVAATNANATVLAELLKHGADPNARDEYSSAREMCANDEQWTASTQAQRDEEFFNGRHFDFGSCLWYTALHYAVWAGCEQCVETLLAYGADPLLKNAHHVKPLDLVPTTHRIRQMLMKAENDAILLANQQQADRLEAEQRRTTKSLEYHLKQSIVGQHYAVKAVCDAVRAKQNGWADEQHPLVFLFLGPSGVGKTELAKALAEYMHNDERVREKCFIRLDMSEYQERWEVSKLIGSAPAGWSATKKAVD